MSDVIFDLTDPAYWSNPYPKIAEARAAGRTAQTNSGEIVLLRAEDVDKVHLNAQFRLPGLEDLQRLGLFDGPFYEWRERTLPVLDGSEHLRLRAFVSSSFSHRQMERLRAVARDRTHELIDRRASAGDMEVLSDLSDDLPLWSMCRFIGIDEADRLEILSFLVGTEEMFISPLTPERRRKGEESIVALNDYVVRLIGRRREEPKNDVISLLLETQAQQNAPNERDLVTLVVNVIGGSVGSTRSAISNAVLEFTRYPDQAEIVRNDPTLIGPAVEECLRINPPFRLARRVAREPVQMFGLELQADQSLFIPRGAYNRDPERFERPDEFDVRRPERRHLSFGLGAHFCLGQAIARINLQEGIAAFLERCHDLELIEEPRRVPFTQDEKFDALRIRFRHVPRL